MSSSPNLFTDLLWFLLSVHFPVLAEQFLLLHFSLFGIKQFILFHSYCQLSIFTIQQLKILVSNVNFNLHHVASQNPGHSIKFVTLPSFILLYRCSMHVISYCNCILMWLVLLSIVWSQVRWFFLWECFCTINHDEITWVNIVVY